MKVTWVSHGTCMEHMGIFLSLSTFQFKVVSTIQGRKPTYADPCSCRWLVRTNLCAIRKMFGNKRSIMKQRQISIQSISHRLLFFFLFFVPWCCFALCHCVLYMFLSSAVPCDFSLSWFIWCLLPPLPDMVLTWWMRKHCVSRVASGVLPMKCWRWKRTSSGVERTTVSKTNGWRIWKCLLGKGETSIETNRFFGFQVNLWGFTLGYLLDFFKGHALLFMFSSSYHGLKQTILVLNHHVFVPIILKDLENMSKTLPSWELTYPYISSFKVRLEIHLSFSPGWLC